MSLPERISRPLLALLTAAAAAATPGWAASALEPPAAEVIAEARALVTAMRAGERGPYSRLRWYCKDGTVHPPTPYACAERGGGRQHGEYSPQRQRLAELGWSVGTVVAALGWDELWDGQRRHQRLRELPLERYLVEIDDGWVLHRARYYRGRVQIEDEEQAGRDLLVRLLSNPTWLQRNFLLAREAVRTLPHNSGADRTRTVRRLSQELSEKDPGFERLRVKIHTTPGPEDLRATREWLATARARRAAPGILATAEALASEMDKLYGDDSWRAAAATTLAGHPRWGELGPLLAGPDGGAPDERLDRLAQAARLVREIVSSSADGAGNLALMDLSVGIERAAMAAAFEVLGRDALSRRDHLLLTRRLLDLVHAAGLSSARERDALRVPLDALLTTSRPATSELITAMRGLRRAAPWALSTIRYTFAEPLDRYTALDPRAARFVDDLLRGSALLPFAEAVTRLAADTDRLSGIAHRVFGETRGGMLGLNPGVARGRLRVVGAAELERGAELGRDEIVVLPETVSELKPVAGILSLAEGNLLSHVQILARNLGIPNATLSPLLARRLAERDGEEVLLAVGTDGSVVLDGWPQVPPAARSVLEAAPRGGAPAAKLAAPEPDLGVRRPLPLAELHAGLSGRVVGPKAANLGELARQFPGRVSPAVALPFGVFADHMRAGADPPKARLDRAFARFRAGEIDATALAAEVESVRQAVEVLRLSADTRERLGAMMDTLFAPVGDYGVFVRSDTNVEDLPGFTGAGLNRTVANLVDREKLFAAIPLVWSSPYTERAMAWRSGILERPEEVYASVLLMKSVPADKSGVLVTADLATRGRGLTVATAWGVGGAVDGEAAETLVLRDDGSTDLIGEAKAPYRRSLAKGGGVEWVPAEAGQVLTAEERAEVRRLAAEAVRKLEPARSASGDALPWDIEFGFVGGRLTLFQVRPLVERGQLLADRVVAGLTADARRQPPATVELDAPLHLE